MTAPMKPKTATIVLTIKPRLFTCPFMMPP
jgi:hypothetical protein